MTNMLFKKNGHEVITATDGLSALECLNNYHPDIIFVDLIMPNISGDKLCPMIRTMPKHQNSTLVMLSAFAGENSLTPAEFGVDACIAKGPFQNTAKHIQRVLDCHIDGTIKELSNKILGIEDIVLRSPAFELLDIKKHFEVILTNVSNGILELNRDSGRIIFTNTVAQEIIGLPEESILSMDLPSIFKDTEGDRIKKILENQSDTPQTIGKKNPVRINNRLLLLNIIPIEDKLGAFTIVVLHDVTDRKKAEEEKAKLESQLHQAQKMEAIGTLAGGIAHDFNNILGIILGHADIALDDILDEKSIKHDLEQVLMAANRAKDLVKQILSFSRQDRGIKEPFYLCRLVEENMKALRSTIPTSVKLRIKIPARCRNNISSCLMVLVDPTQVHQLLINLCINAVQAMNEKGVLEISIKEVKFEDQIPADRSGIEPGIYEQLSVSDTGPGMGPEIIEQIFNPFFSTKEVGKGTGMGLSIVHGIIESHGGKIFVDSEPGKGTVFHLYFPTTEKRPEIKTVGMVTLPTGTERILFIDDEKMMASMGKKILEKQGYSVTAMTNSVEALKLIEKDPTQFDLVVTDQTMPNMTGVELAGQIIKIRPGLPIILCTGYSNIIDEVQAKKIGVSEFVIKPINRQDIVNLTRRVLDRAKTTH